MKDSHFAVVIGGGFFGSVIACHLQRRFGRVVLVEREPELLQRASYANQARVHQGYHYPRSLITALRSRQSYERFTRAYANCLDCSFRHYYAVAASFSKVNSEYFEQFSRRIGASLERVFPRATAAHPGKRSPHPSMPCGDPEPAFSPELIESAFLVEECAFDAVRLRHQVQMELRASGVDVRTNVSAERVAPSPNGLMVLCRDGDGEHQLHAEHVFNCTFAGMNALLRASGIDPLPVKYELAELALVEVPDELQQVGITVMCGPFFSCMPFPALGLHSLSHVRYTPHFTWFDDATTAGTHHEEARRNPPPTHFPLMVRDAARYVPALSQCRHRGSLWEVKTILRSSETTDSRPILFQRNVGLPNLHCVIGAKIDNVYDVLGEIDQSLHTPRMAA